MKKVKIEVHTVKNGYTLDVEGHNNGYMYFTAEELLMGIIAHVGLDEKEPLSKEATLHVLFNALIGSEYAQKIEGMRHNILKLEGELRDKLDRVTKIISRLREYEEIAENLNDRIDRVRVDMRDVEKQNKEDKKLAAELTKMADTLQTKTNQLKEEMKTARQVLREIRLAEAADRKGDDEEEEPKPKPKKVYSSKTAQEKADAYEQKLKKRIERGNVTEFPDAGIILHHTKKKK